MHPVAQFMRQGHHIARFPQIVEHHIRVGICHSGMRKGTGRFALFHRRINPTIGEKRLSQFGHARIKGRISLGHNTARLDPWHDALILHRQGRVAIPDLQGFKAQPLGLKRVIAVRKARIGRHDRVAQRLDHLGLDMVGQMPCRLRGGQFAPPILDLFFFGQSVMHPRKEGQLRSKPLYQRARTRLALGAVLLR